MYNSVFIKGRYQVLKKIGSGGMSSVFLCVDNHIHKKWAVKKIRGTGLNEDLSSVNSEIGLLKSMDYYMFPRITDAFIDEGSMCIVTDYIEGETLSSHLKSYGGLPINRALRYFEELLRALIYLHSMNPPILYLDMKPANIMIRPDGEIRLIDFGIAGSILLKSKSLGTIGYSPPEQYVLGGKLSEKSDVFALGMTLYEMITGEAPNKNLNIQRNNVVSSTIIPSFVKNIILKCTEKNEEDRVSTNELLEIIEEKEKRGRGVISILWCVCALFMFLVGVFYLSMNYYSSYKHMKYKDEMINKAGLYIENGEYTVDGLRIICGYIDGNFLDEETKEYFTYEVAKNYFEIQRDYQSAKAYFLRLDEKKYPEITEYIKICNKMHSFDSEDELLRIMQVEVNESGNEEEEKKKNNG